MSEIGHFDGYLECGGVRGKGTLMELCIGDGRKIKLILIYWFMFQCHFIDVFNKKQILV